jgi:hypothetical protein
MAIQQIHVAYVQPEDRIVMRVRTDPCDECRFWLTRACLNDFLPQVDRWLAGSDDDLPAAGAQRSFERQAAAAGADFSAPFQDGERFPLGQNPVVIQRIQLYPAKGTGHLDLQLVGGPSVTVTLDEAPLARLCRLIGEVAQSAGWKGPVSSGAVAPQLQSGRLH